MRIAFLNRGRETHPGGDIVQLDETMAALRRIGVECDEVGWNAERLKQYDLCHMLHCNFDWSWGNYKAIRESGRKYVLTPIYYPGLLSGITNNQLEEIYRGCAFLTPFSEAEYIDTGTISWSGATGLPVRIIPNGTSKDFHCFRPTSARATRSVLTVSSRGMSDKNCEKVKAASEMAGLPFYLASGMDRHLLIQVLRDSRLFVNASVSERMSLTVGEALCAGCRVLATKENRGNEWYGPGLYTFDPKESVEVLAERIRTAYECSDDDWDWSPNIKARKLTWDLAAAMLKQVYEEVLVQ